MSWKDEGDYRIEQQLRFTIPKWVVADIIDNTPGGKFGAVIALRRYVSEDSGGGRHIKLRDAKEIIDHQWPAQCTKSHNREGRK